MRNGASSKTRRTSTADFVDPLRRRIMAQNRAKGNRSTELRLRMGLIRAGVKGWVLHASHLPGTPDFWFSREQLAIFVDGDFWHGNPRCKTIPKTRESFWKAKIEANRARDIRVSTELRNMGIIARRIWESDLRTKVGLKQEIAHILIALSFHQKGDIRDQRAIIAKRT